MRSGTFSPGSISFEALIEHKGHTVGKTLVLIGAVIAGLGALMLLGVPIGHLPGDFQVRRGHVSFYFPLATSIVVSIVLTLLLSLFRR